jgi:predicted RNase H-related nuclease YkuK (DUF458 family)
VLQEHVVQRGAAGLADVQHVQRLPSVRQRQCRLTARSQRAGAA